MRDDRLDRSRPSERLGFAGLRLGEVAGLRRSDLDLGKGFVCVFRTIEEDEDKTLVEYPPTTLRHYVRLTTAARAKAVAGLDEVTRAALEAAQAHSGEDKSLAFDNVIALAGRRRQAC